MNDSLGLQHPRICRRTAVQAGAVGLLGLGANHLQALRGAGSAVAGETTAASSTAPPRGTARSCIDFFLSGGLSQLGSFDLKPEAPNGIRGEFQPIATATSGFEICEHLLEPARRSADWAVVQSLTHSTNDHTLGHYFMLTGRCVPSPGFRGDRKPQPSDWPSIASTVGVALPAQGRRPARSSRSDPVLGAVYSGRS